MESAYRAYCYAELVVSSLTVAETTASIHYTFLQTDGQSEYAWVAWLNTKMVYLRTVTHPSTNLAGGRATSLMCTVPQPLCYTPARYCQDGLPAHRWSPIPVSTRIDVEQLSWSRQTHYHEVKLPRLKTSKVCKCYNSKVLFYETEVSAKSLWLHGIHCGDM